MTVKFIFSAGGEKTTQVARFLSRHHVAHELTTAEELGIDNGAKRRLDRVPGLEVDGRLFIDPNDGALRKIFHVE